MLIVLSPAKTLDYDTPARTDVCTRPDFIRHSSELIEELRAMSPAKIASLMGISDSLAALNVARFASWSTQFTFQNSKQAILAFDGDVYDGLDGPGMNDAELDYAQNRMRILSGLYGVLRPLDLMQPYRLEMGTRLANPRGRDLYAFWERIPTDALNKALAATGSAALVNLASEEYFKVVQTDLLAAPVITPVFEDWKNGQYKITSFYAKRARGLMARFAASRRATDAETLKEFDSDGYAYDEQDSTDRCWRFRRRVEG